MTQRTVCVTSTDFSFVNTQSTEKIQDRIQFENLHDIDAIIECLRRDGVARVPGHFAREGRLDAIENEIDEALGSKAPWLTHYHLADKLYPWPAGHLAKITTELAASGNRLGATLETMQSTAFRRIVEATAGACADNFVPTIKCSHEWIPGRRNIPLHFDWIRAVKWVCFLSPIDIDHGAIGVRVGSHRPTITLMQRLLAQGFESRDLPSNVEILHEEPPSAKYPRGRTQFALNHAHGSRLVFRVDEYFPSIPLTGERGDLYIFDGALWHLGGMLAHEGCERKLVRGHGRSRKHWGELATDPHGSIYLCETSDQFAGIDCFSPRSDPPSAPA